MIRNSPKDFAEISQRLEICIDLFEDCERNYKKEILLRVVTNKAVQIFLLLFVALIIVLIIAAGILRLNSAFFSEIQSRHFRSTVQSSIMNSYT